MLLDSTLWMLCTVLILLPVLAYSFVVPFEKRWRLHSPYKLPPGPRGSYVRGNLPAFWKSRAQGAMNTYLLSLRHYGQMTTLHMGSQLWVVLNTDRVATDIITKRSRITSERPHMPISSGLVSNGKRSVLQRSDTWIEARRLMYPLLTKPWMIKTVEWQDLESLQLLLSYLEEPTKWYLHQSHYATAVVYGVVTGCRMTKTEAQMREYRKVTMQFLGSIFATAVDFYPILEKLPRPLQVWRHRWESVGQSHRDIFTAWWKAMKASAVRPDSKPSWIRDVLLDTVTGPAGREEDSLFLTNSLVSAGGDNPRMALNVFVMASIKYPHEFQRCRREIDSAIADVYPARLPDPDDIVSMPYVCAFVKECLRWRPIVPLIPPHQLTEDLEYDGFVFPKGTNFLINTVAISADCDQYEKFKPERWLDGNEARLTQGFWGFGGGRRVCIGYKAAQTALFLAVSRLIYCFDFHENGTCDDTNLNHWSDSEPFPVRVTSRSEAHAQLITKLSSAKGLRV